MQRVALKGCTLSFIKIYFSNLAEKKYKIFLIILNDKMFYAFSLFFLLFKQFTFLFEFKINDCR